MNLTFSPRERLASFEWDTRTQKWERPELDRAMLKELSERSTGSSLFRIGRFVLFLAASAAATVWIQRNGAWWMALPALYVYYFFYGFWVAIGHELQHKIVFSSALDRLSEIFFFFVQTLMWHSPRYARVSHRLHHRYTMVRGIDPETPWPEVISYRYVRNTLLSLVAKILVVGALVDLGRNVYAQILRAIGRKDRMMREHCTPADLLAIRIESAAILFLHAGIAALAIVFRRWEPIVFLTLAWQIGSPIESLWHLTEHIGRLQNVKDQRLCTRSIRVGPLVRMLYWGLDDHVDHHLFPAIPSRNLPKLHALLRTDLPEPRSVVGCWREMLAIGREKDRNPTHEYVPFPLPDLSA
jgi:fatty acid desaturase